MKQYTREFIARCIEAHKAAFEEWPHGEIHKAWVDENGDLCIRYAQSEQYWRYKEDAGGHIIWW